MSYRLETREHKSAHWQPASNAQSLAQILAAYYNALATIQKPNQLRITPTKGA